MILFADYFLQQDKNIQGRCGITFSSQWSTWLRPRYDGREEKCKRTRSRRIERETLIRERTELSFFLFFPNFSFALVHLPFRKFLRDKIYLACTFLKNYFSSADNEGLIILFSILPFKITFSKACLNFLIKSTLARKYRRETWRAQPAKLFKRKWIPRSGKHLG